MIYGIIITISILLSTVVATKLANYQHNNKSPMEEYIWGTAFWGILGGIAGARLYHVIDQLPYYQVNYQNVLVIQNGGLSILGAVIGGIVIAAIYLRSAKQPLLPYLDLATAVLPLGQAIGRWGNFVNQELFGRPFAFGIYIDPTRRPTEYYFYDRFHPLFLYESVADLILFLLLVKVYKTKNTPHGKVTALYLAGYGAIRYLLEFLRIGPWTINGLNVAQIVSILMMVCASYMLFQVTSEK